MISAAAPWALNLAALGEAAAATATDYKALVCVFLHGGKDHANTVVPYDTISHAAYEGMRPAFAYGRAALAPTLLVPTAALPGGLEYALAPELAPLLPLFNAQQLAVLLNVGTLVQPTTKAQYLARSVPVPPKLFSHNDQQSVSQSSAPEGATSGCGGRMGDLLMAGNGTASFTCVNVSGNAVFLSGRSAVQYQVSARGPVALDALRNPLFGSAACSAALPTLATAFPVGNSLADQLKMVARMVSTAAEVGARRQVFFVSLGGFDTHAGQSGVHPALLTRLAAALQAFRAAMAELGVADRVTTFTASDFGRTLTGTDGSDHGWGGTHLILGGAVNGGRFYGTAPVIANNGPADVGQGRLLPSTSVDQYAATLGRWLGISDTDLLTVLPNLGRWDVGVRGVGFVLLMATPFLQSSNADRLHAACSGANE